MPYLVPSILITLLRLATVPATQDPDEGPARLETTALGDAARELAADVLVDADSLADLVLLERAAVFAVNLSGERHELRLELADDGEIIGAAVWWIGPAPGHGRYDLGLAMPAIADSATLDAVTVEDGVVILQAGGIRVPLGDERDDAELLDMWDDDEPGC